MASIVSVWDYRDIVVFNCDIIFSKSYESGTTLYLYLQVTIMSGSPFLHSNISLLLIFLWSKCFMHTHVSPWSDTFKLGVIHYYYWVFYSSILLSLLSYCIFRESKKSYPFSIINCIWKNGFASRYTTFKHHVLISNYILDLYPIN